MCGIVAILNVKEQTQALRDKALKMSQKIRHRGPDWSGIYCGGSAILAHERLSIVDPESGGQPLYSPPVPPRGETLAPKASPRGGLEGAVRCLQSMVRYTTIRRFVAVMQASTSSRRVQTVRSSWLSIEASPPAPLQGERGVVTLMSRSAGCWSNLTASLPLSSTTRNATSS